MVFRLYSTLHSTFFKNVKYGLQSTIDSQPLPNFRQNFGVVCLKNFAGVRDGRYADFCGVPCITMRPTVHEKLKRAPAQLNVP